jgi:hypothetical protein
MLYNMSYDIKRMLDDNISPKNVFQMVKRRVERDFHNATWKRIEWTTDGKKYVKKDVVAEFTDVEDVIRIKNDDDLSLDELEVLE